MINNLIQLEEGKATQSRREHIRVGSALGGHPLVRKRGSMPHFSMPAMLCLCFTLLYKQLN